MTPLRMSLLSNHPVVAPRNISVFSNSTRLLKDHQALSCTIQNTLSRDDNCDMRDIFKQLKDATLFEVVADIWALETLRKENILFDSICEVL